MIVKGKRLMPTYLISFLKEIYPGDIPANFGKRMVSRQSIAYLKQMYLLFGGKSIDNFGRDMCPEYLAKYLEYIINADYIEYEDDSIAYTKETPENALKYAFLNYVGGMSYNSENLIVLSDVAETTVDGITYKVKDGIFYASGTANANTTIIFNDLDINLSAGTYYISTFSNDDSNFMCTYADNSIIYTGRNLAYTFTENVIRIRPYIYVTSGQTINYVVKPMLVSGSTAPTEFKVGFEGVRDSAVTSVGDFTIPNEVQSLQGYGQSDPDDPTKYNYIDFSSMKFIREGYIEEGVWVSSPLETDISQYFDSNIIDVSSGETTFNNEYEQAVPSSISYFIPNV